MGQGVLGVWVFVSEWGRGCLFLDGVGVFLDEAGGVCSWVRQVFRCLFLDEVSVVLDGAGGVYLGVCFWMRQGLFLHALLRQEHCAKRVWEFSW